MNVFPNPAGTHVWVNLAGMRSSDGTLQFYDMTGKLLRSERMNGNSRQRISRDELEAGIYLLRWTGNNGEAVSARVIFTE